MKLKLTVEPTSEGLRATIVEQSDAAAAPSALAPFIVSTIADAKKRASSIARRHGLTQYSFVDRTKRKAKA